MASTPALSGTQTFNPALGDITIQAFQMCGVRPSQLTPEHMTSALMAANMMQSTWGAKGVNLWQIAPTTVPLVQGTATYTIPGSVITMLDVYITVGTGTTATDRYIMPVSRTEYASQPNKLTQGFPTLYWFDRLLSPTITFWPVPDGNETSFTYYAVSQIQDANLKNGSLVDIPYYFLEAFLFGLAFRLALVWNPALAAPYKALADEAWTNATTQNIENSMIYLSPTLAGYWRT